MLGFARNAAAVDYQILFRPDGSGNPICYEFTLAAAGGPLLLEVNVLSGEGMRQNWGIDTVGGRGPWEYGVWKNRQFALARVNQLSPAGDDWYGCRTGRPLIGQPIFSMGWPNTPIQYPVQQMWQILFKPNGMGPNCFEFYLAVVGDDRVASPGILTPLARRENWGIDIRGGAGSGPEGTWYDYGSASSRMNDLSSYGGDAYGCRGLARLAPPPFSVGWPPAPDPAGWPPPPPEGNQALWQILRKPNGMGPNCFEFYLTNVGGHRVSAPGILTPLAMREGWAIDFDGGAGSGPAGTWREFSAASSRMNQLSSYGGDWYGCRNRPEPRPSPPPDDDSNDDSNDDRNHQPPDDAPVAPGAREAFIQTAEQRYMERWYPYWCPRLTSGCAIVPKGAKDELVNWANKATRQQQIDRCYRLLDCYDGCVMAVPANETRVGQCRNQCKQLR